MEGPAAAGPAVAPVRAIQSAPKVLLITGASRGIGAATARLAARTGWSVGVNFRSSRAVADALVAEIVTAGGSAVAIEGDVGCEAAVKEMFEVCEARLGALTGLVNNAGIVDRAARFVDLELARWNAVFATNVTGTFLCAREAVRRMSTANGGSGGAIVNLTSVAALTGAASEFIDYAASKGAVDAMTVGLAREVASQGIRVNAVRPGLIETDMQAASGDPERATRLLSTVPMARTGTAAEVAEAILWLLSDASSYCTGATIGVSGGR